jgi:hypothetical protein
MKEGGKVSEKQDLNDAISILEELGDEMDDNVKEALNILKMLYSELEDQIPLQQEMSVEDIISANAYKKGGVMKRVRFQDKVDSISERLQGTKVPKRLRKDYGATYDKQESEMAARRIAGSMLKKYGK